MVFCSLWSQNSSFQHLILLGSFSYQLFSSALSGRYETSCTTEQIPSRLWPGGEKWPMLRWYPGFKGHMGQRFLCSQPQVCCHNYWSQRWWSFPCSSSSQGKFVMGHLINATGSHKLQCVFGLGWEGRTCKLDFSCVLYLHLHEHWWKHIIT